jgi:ribosomal protein S18 acetylase RimI-like enzyme
MVGLPEWPLFEAVLVAIAVDPSVRGAGIGRALLETVHREVLEERGDLVLISLDVAADNPSARALFEKAGYQYEDGEPQRYEGGQPALSMNLLLVRPDDGSGSSVTGRPRRPSRRR